MNKLLIVWKSNNEIDIHNFVIPYAYNAKSHEWFDEVNVLIWGASQEIVANDNVISMRVQNLIKNQINVYACKMCSDKVGVTEELEELGVKVMYTGKLLSDCLKDPEFEVITL
jgi:hypothetical protein